jgi:hypothetical protein
MGLGDLNAPRGYTPANNFPKVGTLAWIKWDTKLREQQVSYSTTGGF